MKCHILLRLKCLRSDVRAEIYKYKKGPCNRNKTIIALDKKEESGKKSIVNA